MRDLPRVIRPVLGHNVYVAPTSYVGGDVTIGDDCTIMHHVVIRGDVSAIRIGNPANWKQATAAISESIGAVDVVSDEEILDAQIWLAQNEGVFVEPASAASIAGLFKCCDSKSAAYSFQEIPDASRIVCTVTGHGLKDPDVILRRVEELKPVTAKIDNVRRAIGS